MKTAIFWVVTQRVGVISCRRFGTTYRVPSSGLKLTPEDGTDKWSRNVGKKLPLLAAQKPRRVQVSLINLVSTKTFQLSLHKLHWKPPFSLFEVSKHLYSHEITHSYQFLTFCWPCIFVYLSQYLTNLMRKICFTASFISCLYMFRAHVLIIRRSKLH